MMVQAMDEQLKIYKQGDLKGKYQIQAVLNERDKLKLQVKKLQEQGGGGNINNFENNYTGLLPVHQYNDGAQGTPGAKRKIMAAKNYQQQPAPIRAKTDLRNYPQQPVYVEAGAGLPEDDDDELRPLNNYSTR